MIDANALEIAIVKSKKTKKEIAQHLSLSDMGFYKKMRGVTEFKASEIEKLKDFLSLSLEEAAAIFLRSM